MKILFCGCIYGAGNIGDDAILAGLLRAFSLAVPDAELGVVSYNPTKTRVDFDLEHVWGLSFQETRSAFKWATHVVLGGATLISENPTVKYPLRHCCNLIDHAIFSNKPISMLAAGASNIRSQYAKRLLDRYYEENLDLITVRSPYDLKQAVSAGGLSEDKLNIAADAAFAVDVSPVAHRGKFLGVSLVDEARQGDVLIEKLTVAVKAFLDEKTLRPVGICSETRPYPYYDRDTNAKVLERVGIPFDMSGEYLSCPEFFETLAGCQLVVTMRMHVVVFCALLKIPCVAIVREQKINSMLSELGLPDGIEMSFKSDELLQKMEDAFEHPEKYLVGDEKIQELKDRACLNAKLWRERYTTGPSVRKHSILARGLAGGRIVGWELRKIAIRGYAKVCRIFSLGANS
jgi:polysaccharide pyruvyl transferase WcaK-like protein